MVPQLPSLMPSFSSTHCRQDHRQPSITESRYGGPNPPYMANHKLVAPEPVKSLPVGEQARLLKALQGDLGRGSAPSGWPCPPPRALSFSATGETKEEGLEGQISRLAELIGRLESKVGPPHTYLTFLPALSTLELAGKLRHPGVLWVGRELGLRPWS